MKTPWIFGGAVAVVAIASFVSYSLTVSPKKPSSDHPSERDVLWVCVAENETHDFSLKVRQLADEANLHCPVCDSIEIFRAMACPECGRHYPIGRYSASPTNCMYCNAELPGKDVSTFHAHAGH